MMDDDNEDGADEFEDDDDDAELAAMLAKVQKIQQIEHVCQEDHNSSHFDATQHEVSKTLEVSIPARNDSGPKSSSSSLNSTRQRSSPAGSITSRSADGITTVSRMALGGGRLRGADVLLGVKKPVLFEEKLLQTVKDSQILEQLKDQVVAAPSPAIRVYCVLTKSASNK